MEISEGEKTTIIIIYGPNEDDTKENKDKFWEVLTDTIDKVKGTIYVIGDFNGRIGNNNNNNLTNVHGPYGEYVKNNNGKRLIDFSIENNLIITNTFFKHKEIHKYTRVQNSRKEKSIIDYILTNIENKKNVKDVKARRGPEIGSDHHILLAKIRTNKNWKILQQYPKSITKACIKNYKLNDYKVAEKYRKVIEETYDTMKNTGKTSVEDKWNNYKTVILKAARSSCGIINQNKNKKQTKWWNQEIKESVKIKKQKWKKYLQTQKQEDYEEYKNNRRKVKELVREEKRKTWEDFGNKLEKDSKGNQKLFYKIVKNLRKPKQITMQQIKNKNGKILNEENTIMNRWKEYFETLLSITTDTRKIEERDNEIPKTELTITSEDNISEQEILESIRKLKRGKAGGHDTITPEMIKQMGSKGLEMLLDLINAAWEQGEVPSDWEIGVILPIHKKGDPRECTNYRGITLLSVAAKVYEDILNRRLKKIIDPQLDEAQCGFRKGRSAQDQIFIVKQIIEKTKKQNNNAFLTFIDLEKAFDRVNREHIWSSLIKRQVPPKLLTAIQSVYKRNRNYIRTNNMESTEFTTKNGLRQGGVLSPTLFNVIMDEIIRATRTKTKKLQIGYHKLRPITIAECAFADDLVIWAGNVRDMQENINIWNNTLSKWNMKINITKTKVMHIGKDNINVNISINGQQIEQVTNFKYLGVKIDRSGYEEMEIQERIQNTTKLFYMLKNTIIGKKEISKKTKLTVYKTIFRPTLIYGSESWTLNETLRSKIQATEMRYLRKMKGITIMDKISNDKIREELEIESILEKVETQKLKWFGHIVRMCENKPTKNIWECKTPNKRNRGRPRLTWNDELVKILHKRNTTWDEAVKRAKNKKAWTKFVHKQGKTRD